MKKVYTIAFLFSFFALFMLAGLQKAEACDRTDIALDSVIFDGTNYTIYSTVCIGAGVTGTTNGADSDTRDIAFGFYTPGGGPINILSFTPASIVGDTTACPLVGANAGPQGAPFNSQGTVGYLDPYYYYYPYIPCNLGYLCITSTALCGNAHAQCTQYSWVVDVLPDSIRLFGAEGAGNPQGGCYPNPDMLINFTSLPVIWGDFDGFNHEQGIRLQWATLSETNNDYFQIQRANESGGFEAIGTVDATGNSKQVRQYDWIDYHPHPGNARYKIVQVDENGSKDETEIITMRYQPPAGLSWHEVGPSPTSGTVHLTFLSDRTESLQLQVIDVKGSQVLKQEVKSVIGSNKFEIDLSEFKSGIYYLRLSGARSHLDYKLVKI